MPRTGVERFSVSAPHDLLREFDDLTGGLGQDRSKAIQQAMRLFLSEHRWMSKEGECAGAIIVTYDHGVHEAEEEITDLQHQFRGVVNSALHLHIDESNCLQMIAIRGQTEGVSQLIGRLSACKGVKQVRFTVLSI
jgi:CopG family nickel-responsive transcriptional regulator